MQRLTRLAIAATVIGITALPLALARAAGMETAAEAAAKSAGCISCHTSTDRSSMHDSPAVTLGCTDCHGGNAQVFAATSFVRDQVAYRNAFDRAHIAPRFPGEWKYPGSANPQRSYTLLNREDPAFIRFVNPSDYRVVREACGACHMPIIEKATRSLMATGAMFWGGASYNNGLLPFKNYILGEAYTSQGQAASISGPLLPDPKTAMMEHGILSNLLPLPA